MWAKTPESRAAAIAQLAPAIGALTFAGALLLFPLRWIFCTSAADKPRAAYRLRLLHKSLGALIVAASVSYLLFLVASVPLRARLDAQTQQLVQRGEVALMLQNAPAPR